ncbi:hypothetical protein GCM10020331_057410 [Ectobacillus funiculus]
MGVFVMERNVVVQLQHGLQARHANQFVQKKSSAFNSEISIIKKNGRMAAGKGIIGVMALVIRKGEEITLLANGSDEEAAIVALESFSF